MGTRKGIGFALCALALLALLPVPPLSAQVPDFVGWEMGFVIPDGQEQEPYPLSEGQISIEFWIRNDNAAGDIEISLEYDSDNDGSTDGPETATVSGGANDTFTMTAGGGDVWNMASGTTYGFEIQGELTSWAVFPSLVPVSSESIDGELIVPELFRWRVEYTDIGHPVNAGTEFQVDVKLWNDGNTQDSFSSYDLEDNCPLLTVEDDSLEDVKGSVAQRGTSLSVTLEYDASSTHPSRDCNLELSIRSTGVANGGMGDTSNKGELDVTIEAKPVGSQQNNNDANTGGDDGPQNQEVVESENFLMMPYLAAPMSLILAAILRRRDD
ncbi:MAG: hypothetical protein QGF94_03740 [Candidatus Thalassarchaeaceae archaeon]|jgi:hypothetical protein|nr:hypothetical protein [Candidatus Thalassarchaeaceae archaeon]